MTRCHICWSMALGRLGRCVRSRLGRRNIRGRLGWSIGRSIGRTRGWRLGRRYSGCRCFIRHHGIATRSASRVVIIRFVQKISKGIFAFDLDFILFGSIITNFHFDLVIVYIANIIRRIAIVIGFIVAKILKIIRTTPTIKDTIIIVQPRDSRQHIAVCFLVQTIRFVTTLVRL